MEDMEQGWVEDVWKTGSVGGRRMCGRQGVGVGGCVEDREWRREGGCVEDKEWGGRMCGRQGVGRDDDVWKT